MPTKWAKNGLIWNTIFGPERCTSNACKGQEGWCCVRLRTTWTSKCLFRMSGVARTARRDPFRALRACCAFPLCCFLSILLAAFSAARLFLSASHTIRVAFLASCAVTFSIARRPFTFCFSLNADSDNFGRDFKFGAKIKVSVSKYLADTENL